MSPDTNRWNFDNTTWCINKLCMSWTTVPTISVHLTYFPCQHFIVWQVACCCTFPWYARDTDCITHAHTHMHVHPPHTHTHTYIHKCTSAHTHTNTLTHTHTHTYTLNLHVDYVHWPDHCLLGFFSSSGCECQQPELGQGFLRSIFHPQSAEIDAIYL